ncbi:MAG: hypothetical protein OEM52_09195, partial [bacterium]|nr:hypothetical protein [bacterium]
MQILTTAVVVLLTLLSISSANAGIPIKLDATSVITIQTALPGMSLDESSRLLRARLQEWHAKDPKPELHVEMFGDSALLMAGDQTIWGFGSEEQRATGIQPAVLALKLELALREIVYSKSVVQETRDPLSRLLIALILIPLALVILWASWVRIMRYLRVAFLKSRKGGQRVSQSHYYIQTVDLTFTIVTRIGLLFIV